MEQDEQQRGNNIYVPREEAQVKKEEEKFT